tara:strand:+ start:295 stop:774 length:480 start_codon:yes stop_codon:yes gene_type:complete
MEEEKSKSQKKRDAYQLKQLGVELVALSDKKLNQLPIPEHLMKAIMVAKEIKSFGAKKRQALFIGKLIRSIEHEAIVETLKKIQDADRAKSAEFHQMEQWRARFLKEGNAALTAFVEQYQPDDLQKLRQLIKKAQTDINNQKNTGASKALFQEIRRIMS